MTGIEIPALLIPKVALVTDGSSGIGKAAAAPDDVARAVVA